MGLVNWWMKITGRKPTIAPMAEEIVLAHKEPEVSLISGQLVEILGPSPSLVGERGRIIHDFGDGHHFEVYVTHLSSSYILHRANLKPLEVSPL